MFTSDKEKDELIKKSIMEKKIKQKPGRKPTGKAGGKKLIYFSFDALQALAQSNVKNLSGYISNLIVNDLKRASDI